MLRLILLFAFLLGVLASCTAFRPQEDWSTVPATNNPHNIIDRNQGSAMGAPEY